MKLTNDLEQQGMWGIAVADTSYLAPKETVLDLLLSLASSGGLLQQFTVRLLDMENNHSYEIETTDETMFDFFMNLKEASEATQKPFDQLIRETLKSVNEAMDFFQLSEYEVAQN